MVSEHKLLVLAFPLQEEEEKLSGRRRALKKHGRKGALGKIEEKPLKWELSPLKLLFSDARRRRSKMKMLTATSRSCSRDGEKPAEAKQGGEEKELSVAGKEEEEESLKLSRDKGQRKKKLTEKGESFHL